MSVILLLITFFLCIAITGNGKKIKREWEIKCNENPEGLKEVFPYIPNEKKICRYYFSGAIKEKTICNNEFECVNCFIHKKCKEIDFDNFSIRNEIKINGVTFNPCLFYHRGHTFINIGKNGYVKVGIDSLLKKLFSSANGVTFHDEGDFIDGDEICTSFKLKDREYPVLSPISGEILRVNDDILVDIKGYGNDFPWLYIVKPFNLSMDLQKLLYGREAINWFKYEINTLISISGINREFAADGGELIFENLEISGEELIKNFLLSLNIKKGGIS